MSPLPTEVNVDNVLSRLTLEEKVSLLAAKDWWRTPVIKRNGVFVPHIKVRALQSVWITKGID
jgi:beta-glucosidase